MSHDPEYKISVPVLLHEHLRKEEILRALQACGAERVFLATGILSFREEENNALTDMLRESVTYFQEKGLEVGIWFWSFWRKGLDAEEAEKCLMVNAKGERRISADTGDGGEGKCSGFCCPASGEFLVRAMEEVRRLASTGADILLLDDDFRFGFYDLSMGCFCNAHMRLYERKLGRKISREQLAEQIYARYPGEIRRTVSEVLGQSLEDFAGRVRDAADEVNPRIRIGICGVMSLWDTDGTDSIRIAKILAGNTRPLLRLTGAPYWAATKSWGNRLQHTIELERMQASWCCKEKIEIMTEGDVYPRPRHRVPAGFLEGFDTALRASGVGDGILKYMLDYTASVGYETGYLERHRENKRLYKEIARLFHGKRDAGVRVYEAKNKFRNCELSEIDHPEEYVQNQFFSLGARMLSDNTVPTMYRGNEGVGIALGENARSLPRTAFENGLIVDIRAARILTEQGIDVGIEEIGEKYAADTLFYPAENEYVSSGYYERAAYRLTVKGAAEIVTYAVSGQNRYPDAFLYQNRAGQRFLVYAFDAAQIHEDRYRSYSMQRQLYTAAEWLSGKMLPAKCGGNPDLYILCRKDDSGMTVGLWNFFPDAVREPMIELDRIYKECEFVNCRGKLAGKTVRLSALQPYDFAFVNVRN